MLRSLLRRVLPYQVWSSSEISRALNYHRGKSALAATAATAAELKTFLASQPGPSTLFTGHQKSGNTWTRLVVYNYFRCLQEGMAKETLAIEELNALQPLVLGRGLDHALPQGYPLFFRSHSKYGPLFTLFDTVAYVYRDPLDTLISLYYFRTRRSVPAMPAGLGPAERKRLLDSIDAFVLHFIHEWVVFHLLTLPKADVVLRYEDMKQDPMGSFLPLLQRMKDSAVDEEVLAHSIRLSDFTEVQRRQRTTGNTKGMAEDLHVEFTRSGETGQYEYELAPSTIQAVHRLLRGQGLDPAGRFLH